MGLITGLIAWCAWQFLDFTNRGQVVIFSVALIIITIVNTSAGIWALVRHEQVDVLPVAQLEPIFERAVSSDKARWDQMHSKLHCCGINGPGDYQDQNAIPWSCCDIVTSLASSHDSKGVCTTMYARGCQHVVINRIKSILLHIFLLALSTVLLQVCFIVCMTCYTRASQERMERRKDSIMSARSSKETGTNDNLLSP
ncbi:Tetraspanin-3 [Dufourea novaeangliae]|uniref:Tetraspanin-3 n=2 Tax=Dufourea novaeangliae TaxID=178035 RepID=A0A154PEP8_DUFNO|nr:Tetraspanin-3 [Dufourea novaeangliae]